ncbi:MAG: UDP-N-acetylmuramoyl-tripeptide--D-alanyl-D-alanine ligase [bacterium]|nr:UDP-N-acetylmuramoyl-tripeptide--D-alanyl-D-alanine ligase [bacterium]
MREIFKKIIVGALTLEARLLVSRLKPKILMVTGSVGKTSTKDAIFTALNSFLKVRKSEKSFNTEFGVPLTILGLKNAWGNPFFWLWNLIIGLFRALAISDYPEWLVLEVGADHPEDLQKLTKWLKPDVTVVTRLPDIPPHVVYYSSPESLIEEESVPATKLKEGGTLILNSDDEKVLALGQNCRGKVLTYGLTPKADIYSLGDEIVYETKHGREVPMGMRFIVVYENNRISFELHDCLGIQHIYPVLAGVATALSLGAKLEKLHEAFETHRAPNGRMRIIEGIKGTTIIDDSYNSSPVAVELALLTLKQLKVSGRRIAALGDMRELGSYAKEEHQKIGNLAAKICNILITVGPLSREIVEGALDTLMDEKNIYQFEDSKTAGKFLEGIIREGDTVLVKGSQNTIRMEWLVEEIMAHPENKGKLLVRQDNEWQSR